MPVARTRGTGAPRRARYVRTAGSTGAALGTRRKRTVPSPDGPRQRTRSVSARATSPQSSIRSDATVTTAMPSARETSVANGSADGVIDRFVREPVGVRVPCARHVLDARAELADQPQRALRERLERRVPDAVCPGHLLHQELAVEPDDEIADAAPLRLFKTHDERLVLGAIVRGMTEVLAKLGDDRAVGGEEHRAGSGRSGIATRR